MRLMGIVLGALLAVGLSGPVWADAAVMQVAQVEAGPEAQAREETKAERKAREKAERQARKEKKRAEKEARKKRRQAAKANRECRRVKETGSRIASRVCRTPSEWRRIEENSRDSVERVKEGVTRNTAGGDS